MPDGPTVAQLERAFMSVGRRAGPGVDGVPGPRFATDLSGRCARLASSVRSRRYRPRPLLRRTRSKAHGGVRILGIPTVQDRVLQRAVVDLLTPRSESLLLDGAHGYRPRRSPATAARWLCAQSEKGPCVGWIHADLEALFDRIRHVDVLPAVGVVAPPPWVRWVIGRWCAAWPTTPGRGLPQGAPLSPLLANLVLHRVLDRHLQARCSGSVRTLSAWVRYGDDVVLLTSVAPTTVLVWLQGLLRLHGLALSRGKVWLAEARPGPLPRAFLGQALRWEATAGSLRLVQFPIRW